MKLKNIKNEFIKSCHLRQEIAFYPKEEWILKGIMLKKVKKEMVIIQTEFK